MALFTAFFVVFFLWMVFTGDSDDECLEEEPYSPPLWFRLWAESLGPCNFRAFVAIACLTLIWLLAMCCVLFMALKAVLCCPNVGVECQPERQVIAGCSREATYASSYQAPRCAPPQCGSHSQGSQREQGYKVADQQRATVQKSARIPACKPANQGMAAIPEPPRNTRVQAIKLANQEMATIPEPRRSARIKAYTVAKKMAAVQELGRNRKNQD